MESLLQEAEELAGRGVKELIVIAQDITRYGLDREDGNNLSKLLRALCRLPFRWIRLHYLYPKAVTDELIETIAGERKILHYLDIPIQHCNDGILSAMRRRTTKAELIALFDKLRAAMPDVVIGTSLICGLPGETDEAFEELCDFLREQKLQRAGVFQYYPGRRGLWPPGWRTRWTTTRPAGRVELVVDLQSRVMDEWNESRLGETVEVLCEGFDPQEGCYVGRTWADSPEMTAGCSLPREA